jgi:hypothetical protein
VLIGCLLESGILIGCFLEVSAEGVQLLQQVFIFTTQPIKFPRK